MPEYLTFIDFSSLKKILNYIKNETGNNTNDLKAFKGQKVKLTFKKNIFKKPQPQPYNYQTGDAQVSSFNNPILGSLEDDYKVDCTVEINGKNRTEFTFLDKGEQECRIIKELDEIYTYIIRYSGQTGKQNNSNNTNPGPIPNNSNGEDELMNIFSSMNNVDPECRYIVVDDFKFNNKNNNQKQKVCRVQVLQQQITENAGSTPLKSVFNDIQNQQQKKQGQSKGQQNNPGGGQQQRRTKNVDTGVTVEVYPRREDGLFISQINNLGVPINVVPQNNRGLQTQVGRQQQNKQVKVQVGGQQQKKQVQVQVGRQQQQKKQVKVQGGGQVNVVPQGGGQQQQNKQVKVQSSMNQQRRVFAQNRIKDLITYLVSDDREKDLQEDLYIITELCNNLLYPFLSIEQKGQIMGYINHYKNKKYNESTNRNLGLK